MFQAPARSASSGGVASKRRTASQPTPTESSTPQDIASGNSQRLSGKSSWNTFRASKPPTSAGAGDQAGNGADHRQLGQQCLTQLDSPCAERAHHRQLVTPFIEGREQCRTQHDRASRQREKENELHCPGHLAHDHLDLRKNGTDIDQRQVGKTLD